MIGNGRSGISGATIEPPINGRRRYRLIYQRRAIKRGIERRLFFRRAIVLIVAVFRQGEENTVRIGAYAHETAGFLWIVVLAAVLLLERARPARTDLIGQVLIWSLITPARRGLIAGRQSLGGEPV